MKIAISILVEENELVRALELEKGIAHLLPRNVETSFVVLSEMKEEELKEND